MNETHRLGLVDAVGTRAAGTPGTSADPVTFAYAGYESPFPGLVDEVAIYDVALTPARIMAHYNAGRCYRDEPRADSLVAHWRLGEPAGTAVAFDSKGTNHGVFNGGVALGQAGALDGDSNTAASFDGADDAIDVPYAAGLNPSQFTVEAWVYGTGGAGTTRSVIDSRNPGASQGYAVRAASNDKWQVTVGNGTSFVNVDASTVRLNAWTHVAATYDGSIVRVYVNGLLEGSVSTTFGANASRALAIGSDGAAGAFFPGRIDEVAIYDAALSQSRVQAHYIAGRPYRDVVLDRAPVSYWRLGEAAGATTAVDEQATNNGTYTNGPLLAQPGAVPGEVNPSVKFDGSNDFVDIAHSPSLNLTSAVSVEAWVRDAATKNKAILEKTVGGTVNTQYLLFEENNYWYWRVVKGGAMYSIYSNTATDQTRWTHVVGTYDGSTIRLYVNGVLQTLTASVAAPIAGGTGQTFIGKLGSNIYYQDGRLDEVAVYNYALSAAQVKLHYDAGRDAPR